MTGCSKVSPGCDNCYAETIANKFGPPAFPNYFNPTYKPQKLNQPKTWKEPAIVFVNSMSDIHHDAFTQQQIDSVYDAMVGIDQHQYLVLTKRPQRMARYFMGSDETGPGWLERRNRESVPPHIWLGTSIESDKYTFRANHLRRIPVPVRFISAEPLLGPLPSLDLEGIGWVIVGGESGLGYRPMPHEWAIDIRDACAQSRTAFFFKQSAAPRTEMGMELEGKRYEEYPDPSALDPFNGYKP